MCEYCENEENMAVTHGVTNDHVIIGATNLIDDIDKAVKRRFTEHHEIKRLSSDERFAFIKQYLTSTGFEFDKQSAIKYANENHTQAQIMNHITRSIAKTLIEKKEIVCL